jgi:hypothetical protein
MRANLHTVAVSAGILCVMCRECGHRAALGCGRLPIWRGNMQSLADLKLRCTGCGSDMVAHYIPFTGQEAEDFIAGLTDLAHRRE